MRYIGQVMSKNDQYDNDGYTILELIIVTAILSILLAIAFPSIIGYVEIANEKVCNFNCLKLGETYEAYLELENLEHSETIIDNFLKDNADICPSQGKISYKEGKFKCGIHSDEEDDDVPYL